MARLKSRAKRGSCAINPGALTDFFFFFFFEREMMDTCDRLERRVDST